MTTTSNLSPKARELLRELQRHDLDYTFVDERTYRELRDAGLAAVVFSKTGNRVFATERGRNTAA